MDFTNINPEKLTLTLALIVAIIALWRFAIAGLKKRDDDRAEVVAVYKLTAEKSEENAAKALAVIEANTESNDRMAKAMEDLRRSVEAGR